MNIHDTYVEKGYAHIQKMAEQFGICVDDWDKMRIESPKIMARITDIEDTNTKNISEKQTKDLVRSWVKNYQIAFERRAKFKHQEMEKAS